MRVVSLFFVIVSSFLLCKRSEEVVKKAPAGDIMVKIGDTVIYTSEFKAFLDSLPEIRKVELARNPENMTRVIAEFIEAVAVLEYAKKNGYLDRPQVKIRWIINSADILRPYIYEDEVKPYLQVSFPEIQDFYEKNKELFKHSEVVRLMKIDSENKKELEEIRKRIKNVQDFINIAQERHNPAEFDMGYVSRDLLPPDIAELVFSMEKGEISKPLEFRGKYAILAVVDKVEEGYWELERVIDQVFKAVRNKKIRDRISKITKDLILSTEFYVNFEAIERDLNVQLRRERFEELFFQRLQ